MVYKGNKIVKSASEKTEIVNSKLKPDVNDPYFYCRACTITFYRKRINMEHLRVTHDIHEKPNKLPSKSEVRGSNKLSKINHPEFFCRTCKVKFPKPLYRWYLKEYHDIIHPAIQGFIDEENYARYSSYYAHQTPFY